MCPFFWVQPFVIKQKTGNNFVDIFEIFSHHSLDLFEQKYYNVYRIFILVFLHIQYVVNVRVSFFSNFLKVIQGRR